MQGDSPDEEHINPHGECAHEIAQLRLHNSALTDALRKMALVKFYGTDGSFKKASCEICEAECGPDQMITHVGGCPLTILNHSQ